MDTLTNVLESIAVFTVIFGLWFWAIWLHCKDKKEFAEDRKNWSEWASIPGFLFPEDIKRAVKNGWLDPA